MNKRTGILSSTLNFLMLIIPALHSFKFWHRVLKCATDVFLSVFIPISIQWQRRRGRESTRFQPVGKKRRLEEEVVVIDESSEGEEGEELGQPRPSAFITARNQHVGSLAWREQLAYFSISIALFAFLGWDVVQILIVQTVSYRT